MTLLTPQISASTADTTNVLSARCIAARVCCGRSLRSCLAHPACMRHTFGPAGTPCAAEATRSGDLFMAEETTATRQRLFGDIAPVYDELNDRLSLGQHKVWKRMAVKWCGASRGQQVLDVCCGSGDLALLLAKIVGPAGQAVGLDFAAEMLTDAKQREQEQQFPGTARRAASVEWVLGDATQLPFEDASFDAATMGYGLRNVANIPQALSELHRVLRPGASVSILDFNNSSDFIVDATQAWALENVVVPAARSYGLEDEYRYLRPSIKAFPTGREQEALAKRSGFRRAVHYEIAFGLMGILVARK